MCVCFCVFFLMSGLGFTMCVFNLPQFKIFHFMYILRHYHIIPFIPPILGEFNFYFCLYYFTIVMVTFLYQLDWATGCPDTWSNIILGYVCEGIFGFD